MSDEERLMPPEPCGRCRQTMVTRAWSSNHDAIAGACKSFGMPMPPPLCEPCRVKHDAELDMRTSHERTVDLRLWREFKANKMSGHEFRDRVNDRGIYWPLMDRYLASKPTGGKGKTKF